MFVNIFREIDNRKLVGQLAENRRRTLAKIPAGQQMPSKQYWDTSLEVHLLIDLFIHRYRNGCAIQRHSHPERLLKES